MRAIGLCKVLTFSPIAGQDNRRFRVVNDPDYGYEV
jgi:hypothetical protein